MIIECDAYARTLDGTRAYAALRGEVRDTLDRLLTHDRLAGTRVGRSAFVAASICMVEALSDEDFEVFLELAQEYENELPR